MNEPVTMGEGELTLDELRERLNDPTYLPANAEIKKAFPLDYNRYPGDRHGYPSSEFADYWRNPNKPIFELLNQEFISALADYLIERALTYGASETRPLVILEIGAGDGRLSHFLQQALDAHAPGLVTVIASDSSDWKIAPVYPVERLDYTAALTQYRPSIVICSWMPYRKDFTADIRLTSSVKEYVLIGEVKGCCGDEELTWGLPPQSAFLDDEFETAQGYLTDGFEMIELSDISGHQISRSWERDDKDLSKTVTFRRMQ